MTFIGTLWHTDYGLHVHLRGVGVCLAQKDVFSRTFHHFAGWSYAPAVPPNQL